MNVKELKQHILAYVAKHGTKFSIVKVGPVGDEQSLSVSDGIMALDYRVTPLTARLLFSIKDKEKNSEKQTVAMLRSKLDDETNAVINNLWIYEKILNQ